MRRLAIMCLGYGGLYTVYGVVIKYFVGSKSIVHMSGMEFLYHSTLWSMSLALSTILLLGWPSRLKKQGDTGFSARFPIFNHTWIIWSGVCTGFVVPTTSLMYTFGFNVMVAMIIMRNGLIITSPGIDTLLIAQGHSNKKVRWQEYAAILVSVCALVIMVLGDWGDKDGNLQFFKSPAVLSTMAAYFFPYAVRLYIMSRFKTRLDQQGFFAIEQTWACITVFGIGALVLVAHKFLGWSPKQVADFAKGAEHTSWSAMLWSTPYAGIAFVSVFIYLYRYGSATFNTTINRLTSLIAGTASTVVFHYWFGGKPVKNHEWGALAVTFVAIGLLTWAGLDDEKERKAKAEAA